ncbi:FAD-dependent oxidoreductase [Rhizobium sp. NPDC090275]|uniref:FAD-dependent oxidoreductase n=1 Tax=Rhizobium sp. NPDC090275 TaxID=3364498 RepID=UPI00383A2D20
MSLKRKDLAGGNALHLQTDVLVVGGGPAGAWAALSAAQNGARVVLADKGYFGTSGATAPSNTGTWLVPPGENRAQIVERRWQRTGNLADQRWMLRTADQAYENLLKLAEWGYPFPDDEDGNLYIANLRGPDYMAFMRRRVLKAGITVLDHHPALELYFDGEAVTGAAGMDRQRNRDWRVDAGAVVLATGGCAFHERIMGAAALTGDGLLMAAEAGASLSGMEFTGKYTLAPFGSSLNKGLPFRWASFFREDSTPILDSDGNHLRNGIGEREREIAKAMIEAPVYAVLDQAEPALQDWLRRGQPNCFLPYDRTPVDPFREIFRVTFRAEGTVRGTGGIRIAAPDCATDVTGLYVAGDAASRELVAGATSGGGGPNSSWAIASGWWSGQGAASHAKRRGNKAFRTNSTPLGQAGLRPGSTSKASLTPKDVIDSVRAEVTPLEKNYFREGGRLRASSEKLDAVWSDVRNHLSASGLDRLKAREAAAITASGRWSVMAALARKESRGMHRRSDCKDSVAAFAHPITLRGLGEISVSAAADSRQEIAS